MLSTLHVSIQKYCRKVISDFCVLFVCSTSTNAKQGCNTLIIE